MLARPPTPPTILVVISDPHCLRHTILALEASGFVVRVAGSLTAAIHAVFRWGPFDALVCDHELPDGSGLAFLHWLREQVIAPPFLLVSGHPPKIFSPSRRLGFLARPFETRELLEAVGRLIPAPLAEAATEGAGRGVAAA